LVDAKDIGLRELALVIEDVDLVWLQFDIRLLQEHSDAVTNGRGLGAGPGKELFREIRRKELFMTVS